MSLVFLASIAWVASVMYRQHRVALYSLGDVSAGRCTERSAVAALTLTASRGCGRGAGKIAWLVLLGGAVYAVFAVIWSARKY